MIHSSAVISPDGLYRYILTRIWDDKLPVLLWVMLNPSTADARVNDRTILTCIEFARVLGYGGIEVVNLYAFRATDPDELSQAADPIGPGNDHWLNVAAARCDAAMLGWGQHAAINLVQAYQGSLRNRPDVVVEILQRYSLELQCLRITKKGQPQHPLYIARNTSPIPFRKGA